LAEKKDDRLELLMRLLATGDRDYAAGELIRSSAGTKLLLEAADGLDLADPISQTLLQAGHAAELIAMRLAALRHGRDTMPGHRAKDELIALVRGADKKDIPRNLAADLLSMAEKGHAQARDVLAVVDPAALGKLAARGLDSEVYPERVAAAKAVLALDEPPRDALDKVTRMVEAATPDEFVGYCQVIETRSHPVELPRALGLLILNLGRARVQGIVQAASNACRNVRLGDD